MSATASSSSSVSNPGSSSGAVLTPPGGDSSIASLQAISHEIAAVEHKIENVEADIQKAEGNIETAKNGADLQYWREEKKQLREKEGQLREKEGQLRKEKQQLREDLRIEKKQQQLAAGAAAIAATVPTKTVTVDCRRVSRTPFELILTGVQHLKQELIDQITRSQVFLPRTITAETMLTMDVVKGGRIIVDFASVVDGDRLELRWTERLREVSASDWTDVHIQQLKIHFVHASNGNQLLTQFTSLPLPEPSSRVQHVLELFEGLSFDFLRDSYEKQITEWRQQTEGCSAQASADEAAGSSSSSSSSGSSHRSRLLNPLWKTLYMMIKYPNVEALVDEFVSLLLRELMVGQYEADYLYVFPQLPLPLTFGVQPNANVKRAIADRTIVDVGSFYRMSVFEDKSVDQQRVNSEPQLIAEAIAAHQSNMLLKGEPVAKKQKTDSSVRAELDDSMFAVRVNGELFFFYSMRITQELLQAMQHKSEAANNTNVFKLCHWPADSIDGQGFSFYSVEDRRLIVTVLDQMCQCIARAGRASRRRESGSDNSPLTHKAGASVAMSDKYTQIRS